MKHDNGEFLQRTVGVLVARQNGKSHLMRMRVLAGMFLFGESWVSMAQNRTLAWEQFDAAVTIVMNTPWLKSEVKRISRVNGHEFLQLNSGARWSIVSATKDGPRGYTANLWVDELRDITEDAWKAATPITRAVQNSQVWVTSNAGDKHSVVLNNLRERALHKPPRTLGWYEWSADPSIAINNKDGWYQANPALGHLIDEGSIEAASLSDTFAAFRTESLCLWVDSVSSPWPLGAWEKCTDKDVSLNVGNPTWLALDVTPRRKRADLVAAQLLDDGRIAVGLIKTWTSDTVVDDTVIAADISHEYRKLNARVLAFDRWTSSNIAQRLAQHGVPVGDVSGAAFAQACDEMLSAIAAQRLVHFGQDELTQHMNACHRKPAADGGWRVVRRASDLDISAACAAIMVLHHAVAPQNVPLIVSA